MKKLLLACLVLLGVGAPGGASAQVLNADGTFYCPFVDLVTTYCEPIEDERVQDLVSKMYPNCGAYNCYGTIVLVCV
ncbi:MAG: hypothetical protein KDD44_13720, partial [Bdellovibrionales bacterium]|nr:hypothetical protein [Bdellovibrionales bacterium]